MAKAEEFLVAPIPGQSLTDTPRNYPWERPPQMDSYEDATKYYINQLANDDVMDDLAVLFDNGLPVSVFVESMTTSGVAEGLHTVDVSLIIAPVLHAFIKAAMTEYGVEAKDEYFDPEIAKEEREKRRLQITIDAALADARANKKNAQNDPGVSILQEIKESMQEDTTEATPEEPMTEEEPMEAPVQEEAPRGLMARGAM
jgi:hypothetical protein